MTYFFGPGDGGVRVALGGAPQGEVLALSNGHLPDPRHGLDRGRNQNLELKKISSSVKENHFVLQMKVATELVMAGRRG